MTLPIQIQLFTAVIAPGNSVSAPVPMGYCNLAAIAMPAVWTAAALTFQVSPDGGVTWLELYNDDGAEVTVQAAASTYVTFVNHGFWVPVNYLTVRSGTAATPIMQSAGATLTLIAGAWNF